MENTYANVLGGCLNPDCFDACSHFRPVIDDDMVRNTCENCCCNAGRHLVTGILVGGKFLEQPASSKRPTVVKQLTFAQLYTKDKCVGTEDLSSLSTDSDMTEMQVGPMPSKDGLGYSTPSMRRYYEAFHASTPTVPTVLYVRSAADGGSDSPVFMGTSGSKRQRKQEN